MQQFKVCGALIWHHPDGGRADVTQVREFIVESESIDEAARVASRIVMAFYNLARANIRFLCSVRTSDGMSGVQRSFDAPDKSVPL